MSWFKKKEVATNTIVPANEKVIVLLFEKDINEVQAELWTLESLWGYMARSYLTGSDPYNLMTIAQNEYALSRAELYGMQKERKLKYGRD